MRREILTLLLHFNYTKIFLVNKIFDDIYIIFTHDTLTTVCCFHSAFIPADIKAVISSANKILVSWLPPLHPNGQLTAHTFYMGIIEDGKEVSSCR